MMLRETKKQTNPQTKAPTQTIRLRIWIGLAAASFIIGLIAFAPARLLEGVANRVLAPQVRVQIADGTIWSGRGVLLLSPGGSANDISPNLNQIYVLLGERLMHGVSPR